MRYALFAAILLFSCAGHTQTADEPVPGFDLEIRDKPDVREFELTLSVPGPSSICFARYQWPNSLGQVDGRSTQAAVMTDRGQFEARERDFGYCIGKDCRIRVLPRRNLTGRVSYDEFPGASLETSATRRLRFSLRPYRC